MHTMRKLEDLALAERLDLCRFLMTPGSRAGRWSQMRHIFKHAEEEPVPARLARYSIFDCGPKTRERWQAEYRHERRCHKITQGRDYAWLDKWTTEKD